MLRSSYGVTLARDKPWGPSWYVGLAAGQVLKLALFPLQTEADSKRKYVWPLNLEHICSCLYLSSARIAGVAPLTRPLGCFLTRFLMLCTTPYNDMKHWRALAGSFCHLRSVTLCCSEDKAGHSGSSETGVQPGLGLGLSHFHLPVTASPPAPSSASFSASSFSFPVKFTCGHHSQLTF